MSFSVTYTTHNNIAVPKYFYGTAWKEEETERLVYEALHAGFVAIDTANQRKHYYEEAVGNAIKKFLAEGHKKRSEIFVQTKFTYARGQDHRKPYDGRADFSTQLLQSFASSQQHLGLQYVDSYVLHGPFSAAVLNEEDLQVWRAMESLLREGKIGFLGVSNVEPEQLSALYEAVQIKPTFVQNRCYASKTWDKKTRDFCREHNIFYQGFSLLTANREQLKRSGIQDIATKYGKSLPQIVFRFSQQLGMITLTGTSNREHMLQDLNIYDFELTREEIHFLENLGA